MRLFKGIMLLMEITDSVRFINKNVWENEFIM